MYDVVYTDQGNRQQLVAAGLARDVACDLARTEARRRGVGRMFLAGSEQSPPGEVILIVESRAA
ncbi:MAG: hypothetical protein ACXWDQ_03435 [Solirubrobacterales bacterium]